MKNFVKAAVLILAIFCAINVNAQSKIKLGHIDSDSLLKIMPGKDSAQVKIEAEIKSYQTQYTAMEAEYNNKVSEYQAGLSSMSDLIKSTKAAEISDLETRITKFQTSAQEAIQKKQTELLQPIIDRAKKAIEDIAKENGYTYIFDSSVGVILYNGGGEDIMPLVKKKIGIK